MTFSDLSHFYRMTLVILVGVEMAHVIQSKSHRIAIFSVIDGNRVIFQ